MFALFHSPSIGVSPGNAKNAHRIRQVREHENFSEIQQWTSVVGILKLQVQYRQHVTVINCYLYITSRIEL